MSSSPAVLSIISSTSVILSLSVPFSPRAPISLDAASVLGTRAGRCHDGIEADVSARDVPRKVVHDAFPLRRRHKPSLAQHLSSLSRRHLLGLTLMVQEQLRHLQLPLRFCRAYISFVLIQLSSDVLSPLLFCREGLLHLSLPLFFDRERFGLALTLQELLHVSFPLRFCRCSLLYLPVPFLPLCCEGFGFPLAGILFSPSLCRRRL